MKLRHPLLRGIQVILCFGASPIFVVVTLVCLLIPGSWNWAQETSHSPFPELEFRKWSGSINVPDPVAISLDHQGRVYVTQTRRRKIQDLDIREHRDWIPTDLSFTSVEQKRAFLRKALAIGGDPEIQKQHVQDWNQDGQYDWRDLTVVSEAIYRLVDRDQDGTADEKTTFAEDFNTEVTGVAAGVLAHGREVYATVAPDVWKLRDQNTDGISDSREVIAHGFGLHIAYGGHDMHGLTVGPDGKVYWSIGDKGIHVTTRDGRNIAYPHQGGVMRANLDGSDFEVFAHGLRNVQEVAFDQYGNLFGVDNDSDQPTEKERFVYIVDDMDAGWRCYYQYRGDQYNPWTDEKLWQLPGDDHPAYLVPPIQYSIDGPAGFKFNPGTALGPAYQDFFFLTGAPNGNQYAFQVQRSGDSFQMVHEHQVGEGIAIVGLAFGPDGGLYGADWDGGYPLDEKGSVIRMDVPPSERFEQRAEVQEFLAEGFEQRSTAELLSLLSHVDMRVRLGAQFELVERSATDQLSAKALDKNLDELARLHAIWGLGQLARTGDYLGRDVLGLMTKDSNAKLRGQAAKTYGELPDVVPAPLLPLLKDEDPYVRTLAGLALARHPTRQAVAALLEQADGLTADQHYLRHGIVAALARCASSEELAGEKTNNNTMHRLCCVLALRRQRNKAVWEYLADPSDWVATEASRAIHDEDSILEALPALAESLTTRDSQTESYFRRAVNANFRIGDAEALSRLIEFLSTRASETRRCEHVLATLSEWLTPPVLDSVEGIYRPIETREREIDLHRLQGPLSRLIVSEDAPLRAAALSAARRLNVELSLDVLQSLIRNEAVDDETRIAALESMNQRLASTMRAAKNSNSDALRMAALRLAVENRQPEAFQDLRKMLESESAITAKQSAIAVLSESTSPEAMSIIVDLGGQLLGGNLDSRLQLDAFTALKKIAPFQEQAKELLDRLNDQVSAAQSPVARYRFSRDGGDPEAGERLFRTHVQAQCARCHRVGDRGSDIGPNLNKIAEKRDADYLLRSIVQPSADMEDKYRTQLILLESDEVLRGVIQSQNPTETVVADSQGKLTSVPSEQIVNQTVQKISLMPDMTEILSPYEVRDLVAYLRTLQ